MMDWIKDKLYDFGLDHPVLYILVMIITTPIALVVVAGCEVLMVLLGTIKMIFHINDDVE